MATKKCQDMKAGALGCYGLNSMSFRNKTATAYWESLSKLWSAVTCHRFWPPVKHTQSGVKSPHSKRLFEFLADLIGADQMHSRLAPLLDEIRSSRPVDRFSRVSNQKQPRIGQTQ